MKIIYIANARIPTEKANGKQIAKTCEAMAKAGLTIELWLPDRKKPESIKTNDLFEFYGITRIFKVKKIPTIDFLIETSGSSKFLQVLFYYLQEISFVLALLDQNYICNAVYTRSITAAIVAKIRGRVPVYYEIHNITENPMSLLVHKFFWARLNGLVVISHGLEEFVKQQGITKVTVISSAVDLEEFKRVDKLIARKKLNLPSNKKLVVYTGSTHERKGVYILAEAAKILQHKNINVIFEGGISNGGDFQKLQQYVLAKNISNVMFAGYNLNFISPTEVTYYLQAADVLVLPDSGLLRERQEFTSPMKLFEYMAVGRPIVASNTRAISDILKNRKNALLVQPDCPNDLAQKIEEILNNSTLALKISRQAKIDSRNYSWSKRADKIINFIKL